jgi:polyisoprenoid-binding protein YceI|tara:strand:+ start:79 stop:348 length:270 start_codon:yes stop_codon:yes gene_type:complete
MLTNVKTAQAACGTDAAGASTFSSATVVRLINTTSTARVVTVVDEVGGSTTIGSFTMLGNSVEFVEKKSTEAIYAADASVLGAKVGYTN